MTEAMAIDRVQRSVTVRDVQNGWTEDDALVMAPGATPIRPPLPDTDASAYPGEGDRGG